MNKLNAHRPWLRVKILGWLTVGLSLATLPARAEDPLLGEIKAIKCVGCTAGKVTLILHDPIDIVDFEVTILDADYEKIITPLPGKRVYDRGDGCFYWNEVPKLTKVAKKDSAKIAPLVPVKEPSKKTELVKNGKKVKPGAKDSVMSASSTQPMAAVAPVPEPTPSKCLPYERVPQAKLGKGD